MSLHRKNVSYGNVNIINVDVYVESYWGLEYNMTKNDFKEMFEYMYYKDLYWLGLLGAFILVVTAPVVVPTRIIYRTFKAVKRYGL